MTTTGLASDDYGAWGGFATVAFFALFFVGGCTGSTSGSIKIFRWQVLVLSLAAQMRRMVSPHRVTLVSYGGKPIPDEVAQPVVNFVVVYVITFVAFRGAGLDRAHFLSASSGVASALSGLGPRRAGDRARRQLRRTAGTPQSCCCALRCFSDASKSLRSLFSSLAGSGSDAN